MRTLSAFLLVLSLPQQSARCDELDLLWEYATPGFLPQAVAVSEDDPRTLFVAMKTGGIAVLHSREGKSPREVARVSKRELAGLDAMNLFLTGDRLFVALGDFFGQGDYAGAALIDVSQSSRPRLLSTWKSSQKQQGSAVIVADKSRVYLGAMHHGVEVLKVTERGKLTHHSTIKLDPDFPRENPGRVQRPNARGLALRGDLLYVANDAGGLRLVDVSGTKPVEISRYINRRMLGKQQAYNNVVLDGDRAFIAIDYAGLEIVDISDPKRIRQIGWWNPWDADTLKNFWFNSPGHTNHLTYDAKLKRIYLSAGDSELQVVDVTKPASPRLVLNYGRSKNGNGAWGVTVADNRAYLSYIQAVVPFQGKWSGIRAVRLD